MPGEPLRRIGNPHDRPRPAGGWWEFLPLYNVGEADAVVLGPDIAEPMMDIAPEHERIGAGVATPLLIGDERRERNGREIHLFCRHFGEFRNRDLDRVRYS